MGYHQNSYQKRFIPVLLFEDKMFSRDLIFSAWILMGSGQILVIEHNYTINGRLGGVLHKLKANICERVNFKEGAISISNCIIELHETSYRLLERLSVPGMIASPAFLMTLLPQHWWADPRLLFLQCLAVRCTKPLVGSLRWPGLAWGGLSTASK